jgi:predicted metalloprotease
MRILKSALSRAATTGALAAVLATPAAVFAAAPSGPPTRPIRVTPQDVTASNKKVAMAYEDLLSMWTTDFAKIGARFASPRIARYDDDILTACGVIRHDNAEYCARNNTIYYDEVFVAGMAKAAGQSLGTDGDMSAVGIIAHEMGHAVAMQLGHESSSSYENESTADCLAGAFAQQAGREGSLEKGDLDEAFYGMSMAGDPIPQSTGNARADAVIQARLARQSHGTKDQRMQNFRNGLDGGPGACLDDFRSLN